MTYDVNWAVETLNRTGNADDSVKQQVTQLVLAAGGALTSSDARQLVQLVRDIPDADGLLLVGENGEPLGTVSPREILDEGSRLAFGLAAVCDDKTAMQRLLGETLRRVGTANIGYVSAAALSVMAEHILAGAFAVTKAYGTDLQAGIARGETPPDLPVGPPPLESQPELDELQQIIAMPDGPDRQAAMEAAMTDSGDLGRLTRAYLRNIANLREDSQ